MSKACINFVFHHHVPFVRDLKAPMISEERWFFENLTYSQLPMLQMLTRLEKDRIPVCLTLSFSGTMLAMLSDDLLKSHYENYLAKLIELGEKEIERTTQKKQEQEKKLALFNKELYEKTLAYFREIKGDLISRYCYFADKGVVELIPSTLTHSFLPSYQSYPFAVDLQIKLGLKLFKDTFNRESLGFWLPECGYYPGLEKALRKRGISYVYLDSHALLLAEGDSPYGPYSPIAVGGVKVLVQDPYACHFFSHCESAYPKREGYRDYFSDIGFNLPLEEINDFLCSKGKRISTGYKYYAQSKDSKPTLYEPHKAQKLSQQLAQDFISHLLSYNDSLKEHMEGRDVLINILCEADLFGHWWFEGIHLLENFYRLLVKEKDLCTTVGSRYLAKTADIPKLIPAYSSWAKSGFSEPWLNHENDWVCRLNHDMIERLEDLINRYADSSSFQQKKMILQAVREVLLAQSSDWPFMIWEGFYKSYAAERVREHHDHFHKICNYLINNKYDVSSFIQMEKQYNLIPSLSLEEILTDVIKGR